MNILVLNWRDPKHPLAGGAEISLYEHIKYWQKKGAKVTWYASFFKNAKKEESLDGIKIIRKGNHYTVALNFFIDWVSGKFRENEVVVDCFHFVPYLTPIYIRNKKIIAFIHEVAREIWFKNIFFPLNTIGYLLEPFIIRFYKRNPFITVSNSTKKELLDIGIPDEKITVIENGVSVPGVNKKYHKEKIPTLIFLGRLSKDKGIMDCLKALVLIKKNIRDVRLWIVGRPESSGYEAELRKFIKSSGLNNNCVFYGFVRNKKKYELLSKAWILLHPSMKEGWGLNVIEANRFGLPSIGYDVPGLRDSIQNNKTGMLIVPNFKNLADSAEKLIIDYKMRYLLSKNALDWSKNFTWERSGLKSWNFIKSYEEK